MLLGTQKQMEDVRRIWSSLLVTVLQRECVYTDRRISLEVLSCGVLRCDGHGSWAYAVRQAGASSAPSLWTVGLWSDVHEAG